jgi:hypothetical protein
VNPICGHPRDGGDRFFGFGRMVQHGFPPSRE